MTKMMKWQIKEVEPLSKMNNMTITFVSPLCGQVHKRMYISQVLLIVLCLLFEMENV